MPALAQVHALCISADPQLPHQLVDAREAKDLPPLLFFWHTAAHEVALHCTLAESEPQNPVCTACALPNLLPAGDAPAKNLAYVGRSDAAIAYKVQTVSDLC
jgi:hypothetical protein